MGRLLPPISYLIKLSGAVRSASLLLGFLNVMPLDFGPIFAGVSSAPVLCCRSRLRTLGGIRGAAILIALGASLILRIDGSAFVFPGTPTGTFCVLGHRGTLLSKTRLLEILVKNLLDLFYQCGSLDIVSFDLGAIFPCIPGTPILFRGTCFGAPTA